jgi:type IV pilus assembly protein PilB
MSDRLGDLLVAQGVVDAQQVGKALALQKTRKIPLGEALVSLGLASEDQVWRVLARQHKLPFVDLVADAAKGGRIRPEIVAAVPAAVAEEQRVVPVALKDGRLVLAVDDPLRTFALDTLSFVLNRDVGAALTTPGGLRAGLRRYYGVNTGSPDVAAALGGAEPEGEDAPVVRLVSRLIEQALEQAASDIHVEPMENRIRVRYRKDGVLHEVASHEVTLMGPLNSRLKIMAGMDIAEKRKPQDGRIAVNVQGRPIDIRASVLPATHGESIVMRLLDKERGLVGLDALGLDGEDLKRLRALVRRPNGIVLVTGPTGSGKTTTLYAALKELNKADTKIITAEDPVEYEIAGINQVQVHARIGLTFARILRAMLRQAPNVILVGEIRDLETAEVAIQAALTGHLVFATLHTNDAPSALTRLIDMGVQPFLVSASVQAVLAQRLVRKLCATCRQPGTPSDSELRAVGLAPARLGGRTLWKAQGCAECAFTGYRGRIGIYELLEMDAALRDLTFRSEPAAVVRAQAERTGRLSTLRDDGLRKVLAGITSIPELLKIVASLEAFA